MLFKIISTIRNTFLTSFYQRAGSKSPPKNSNDDLDFTSFVHDFNFLAHFVMKKYDKVKQKAFQLFETDAESKVCHLFVL